MIGRTSIFPIMPMIGNKMAYTPFSFNFTTKLSSNGSNGPQLRWRKFNLPVCRSLLAGIQGIDPMKWLSKTTLFDARRLKFGVGTLPPYDSNASLFNESNSKKIDRVIFYYFPYNKSSLSLSLIQLFILGGHPSPL